jgi:hypothetical protein
LSVLLSRHSVKIATAATFQSISTLAGSGGSVFTNNNYGTVVPTTGFNGNYSQPSLTGTYTPGSSGDACYVDDTGTIGAGNTYTTAITPLNGSGTVPATQVARRILPGQSAIIYGTSAVVACDNAGDTLLGTTMVYPPNVVGPTGATGPAGPTGATGPTGPAANAGFLYTSVTGVNLNSAGDTSIALTLPSGFTRIRVAQVIVSHASGSLGSTVQVGVFSATGGGGAAIAPSQSLSAITTASDTTNGNMYLLTLFSVNTESVKPVGPTLYFRVTTAAGTAETADVTVFYQPLP